MLKHEDVLAAVKGGRESQAWPDMRDYSRLVEFFPTSEWEAFGFGLKEGADEPKMKPWTREAILEQLKEDVEFGFEKALNKRGISAGCMNGCLKMWMWILEDELQTHDSYAQYGLPLLKAVALKYGFKNEIGDDAGDEDKYAEY